MDQLLPRIAQMKLFQGDNYIDQIFYGEGVFGPLHDPMFIAKSDPKPRIQNSSSQIPRCRGERRHCPAKL